MRTLALGLLLVAACHSDHTELAPVPENHLKAGTGTIPFSATMVPGGTGFGIVNDTDQVGGWAVETSESTIGAIASGRLKLYEYRLSAATGDLYQLTSLTPGGGFANGTWTLVAYGTPATGPDVYGLSDGGTIVMQVSGPTDGGAFQVLPWDIVQGSGSDASVETSIHPTATFNNATSWVTIATLTLSGHEDLDLEDLVVHVRDMSGQANPDAGLNLDAAGGGGACATLNMSEFSARGHIQWMGYPLDGGTTAGNYYVLTAQGGTPFGVADAGLMTLSIDDVHGCQFCNSTAGCAANGTSTWSIAVVVSGATVTVAVQATGTTSWPWYGWLYNAVTRRYYQ